MMDVRDESGKSLPLGEEFTIPPNSGAEVRFRTSGDEFAFCAILLHVPDDVAPHFAIEEIAIGEREKIVSPSAGDLLELGGFFAEDVVVSAWNTTDQVRKFRAVLWTQYENGSLMAQAVGWSGPGELQEFAAWLGRCEIGRRGARSAGPASGRS